MIDMIRVDDRLIHGQVALLWTKQLGINRIIVANDKVASSQLQKNALLMAAPEGVKVAIVPVDKAIKLVHDPRANSLKILMIVNNISDLKKLVESVKSCGKVDLANYGRISGDINKMKKITSTVYLTSDDEKMVNEIIKKADNFVYQPLPTDKPEKIVDLLKGVN